MAATHEFKVFHTVEYVPDPVVDTSEVTVTETTVSEVVTNN